MKKIIPILIGVVIVIGLALVVSGINYKTSPSGDGSVEVSDNAQIQPTANDSISISDSSNVDKTGVDFYIDEDGNRVYILSAVDSPNIDD
jgi:hypothetical protein